MKPASLRPCRNPRIRSIKPSGDTAPRNPITGVAVSCARAASGHAAAAPPGSVTNSRRFTARCSSASDRKDSTGGGLLRCGISVRPMTASGQNATFPSTEMASPQKLTSANHAGTSKSGASCGQSAVHSTTIIWRNALSDHASKGNPTYCSANDAWACSEACR